VERVDQTLDNMIRTYELENFESDYNCPWSQILANCAREIRSTAHSILDATSAQIVFGRDMLFDLFFMTNYSEIKNKNKISDLNVDNENTKRIKYDYRADDLILLDRGTFQSKLVPKRDGPYQVIRVYSNGTLKICKGIYVQRVSIS
jgi:hypothetical protein